MRRPLHMQQFPALGAETYVIASTIVRYSRQAVLTRPLFLVDQINPGLGLTKNRSFRFGPSNVRGLNLIRIVTTLLRDTDQRDGRRLAHLPSAFRQLLPGGKRSLPRHRSSFPNGAAQL